MFAFIKLNEKIESKDFELLPIDEINEDDMLTPKEFQKAVNAAIQLDTQKPVATPKAMPSIVSSSITGGRGSSTESQTQKETIKGNKTDLERAFHCPVQHYKA